MGKTQSSSFTASTFCYLNQTRTKTDNVRIERLPPEREVVSSSHIKYLKNCNRYTQLSAKLPYPNRELNALGPPTQDPGDNSPP